MIKKILFANCISIFFRIKLNLYIKYNVTNVIIKRVTSFAFLLSKFELRDVIFISLI